MIRSGRRCLQIDFRAIKGAVSLKHSSVAPGKIDELNFRAIKGAVSLKHGAETFVEWELAEISAPSKARSH